MNSIQCHSVHPSTSNARIDQILLLTFGLSGTNRDGCFFQHRQKADKDKLWVSRINPESTFVLFHSDLPTPDAYSFLTMGYDAQICG